MQTLLEGAGQVGVDLPVPNVAWERSRKVETNMNIFRALGAVVRAKGWPEPKSSEAYILANELDNLREKLMDWSCNLRGEARFTWADLLRLKEEARRRKKNWVDWVAANLTGMAFGEVPAPQTRDVMKRIRSLVEEQVQHARNFEDVHDVLSLVRRMGTLH